MGTIAHRSAYTPRVGMMSIHRRRPDGYWVRLWVQPTKWEVAKPMEIYRRACLETARAMIPITFKRSEGDDDEGTVGVWISRSGGITKAEVEYLECLIAKGGSGPVGFGGVPIKPLVTRGFVTVVKRNPGMRNPSIVTMTDVGRTYVEMSC